MNKSDILRQIVSVECSNCGKINHVTYDEFVGYCLQCKHKLEPFTNEGEIINGKLPL